MKNFFSNIDLYIACTAMASLIVFTFTGVIMRYAVGKPVTWGEEFQLTCIVFIVFFASGAGFRTKSHVAIDIVADLLPVNIGKIMEGLIYVISVLVLAYFAVQSSFLVRQMFVTGRTTDILEIPYYFIYAAFPVGSILMIINYSIQTYNRLIKGGNT